jgi:hypothetical protein
MTPEQSQYSGRRPDLIIEGIFEGEFYKHMFVEFKSTVGRSFGYAMDQITDTIIQTVDIGQGTFSTFVIIIKGIRIGIFTYYSFVDMISTEEVPNHQGLVPLNYKFNKDQFEELSEDSSLYQLYKDGFLKIPTDPKFLEDIGVESSDKLNFPHMWNLSDSRHQEHIHEMLVYTTQNAPGFYLALEKYNEAIATLATVS